MAKQKMNEEQWLNQSNVPAMVSHLHGVFAKRKNWHLAALASLAVARQRFSTMSKGQQELIIAAERSALGLGSLDRVIKVYNSMKITTLSLPDINFCHALMAMVSPSDFVLAYQAINPWDRFMFLWEARTWKLSGFAAGADALRDVVGNPFDLVEKPIKRPKCPHCGAQWYYMHEPNVMYCRNCQETWDWPKDAHSSPWLTAEVVSLAIGARNDIRADGTLDPVRLMVLADALDDAGCPEPQLTSHLRATRHHAAGCPPCRFRKAGDPCPHCENGVWARTDDCCNVYCESCMETGDVLPEQPTPHYLGCWVLQMILENQW